MGRKRTVSYKTKEGQKVKEVREEQLNQIKKVNEYLKVKKSELADKGKLSLLLKDVAQGLYIEIDKQFKKSPLQEISALTFNQVNEVIKDTKSCIEDDLYLEKIRMFVFDGNYPEVRDVSSILNQIIRVLERFNAQFKGLMSKVAYKIQEAKLIEESLDQFVNYDIEVDLNDIDCNGNLYHWFTNEDEDEDEESFFDFSKLDEINIYEHFGYEQ